MADRSAGAPKRGSVAEDIGVERPDTIASKDRQFVTALARGLEILRAFRPGEVALGNQELSERTGLPKPTVSRLTSTLRELGYLTLHGRTGAYALGPGVLALGYAMIAGLEMRERARPLMEQLARDANATVALGARDRLSVIYLDVARSDSTVTLSMGVGARIPLATSAMGRAVLAALPEGERQYFLDAIKEREPAEYARIKAGVERAVEELATQGFVTSIGEWRDDVHAVAAPVISPDGERLYAINCGGPSFMVSKEALTERFGPELAKVARDLSAPIEALKSGVSDL